MTPFEVREYIVLGGRPPTVSCRTQDRPGSGSPNNLFLDVQPRSRARSQYVKFTMTSSPTTWASYTLRGNFAGPDFGFPVTRSNALLHCGHTTAVLPRSRVPWDSMAHDTVHASSSA